MSGSPGRAAGRLRACLLALLLPAAASAEPHWEPFVEPYGQLFPALLLATATVDSPAVPASGKIIGDPEGLIGVELREAEPGSRYELLLQVPGLAKPARIRGRLPRSDVGPITLLPRIGWDYAALARVEQARPLVLSFELSLDGVSLGERQQRVRLRSVNDALYYIDEPGTQRDLDFNWLFAAYVNEDHPLVDEILALALASGVVEGFTGYQRGDPDQVLKQVFALWHLLYQRGIRYSSIARTANQHPRVLSQHVRFIDQTWVRTQANCVDASVLLASLLRKIDLRPALVLVPGHMFLRVDLDPRGRRQAWLETTLLGTNAATIPRSASTQQRLDAAFDNFAAALDAGQQRADQAGTRLRGKGDAEYQIIDIAAARRMGVMPIGR